MIIKSKQTIEKIQAKNSNFNNQEEINESQHFNLPVRREKILKFWEKKRTKMKPPEKIKQKQKVANKKLRILGQFYSYEKAMILLNDKKRLLELKVSRKVVKQVIQEYDK